MKDQLLIDCFDPHGLILELNESSEKGLTKFRGKFAGADEVNKNKRRYPKAVLDENVQRLMESVNSRGLIGELDHPQDSIIHFDRASHVVTKLWWEGNELWGEAEILTTPLGKLLKSLLNDGVRVGISSRGVGNGKLDENGVLVIGESYKLITFDAVADPSAISAFQEKVTAKKENIEVTQNNPEKNESHSIYKLNKHSIIACLGGMIQEQVSEIKRGLN